MAGLSRRTWFQIPTLRRLALPAMVTVLGMQTLRVYFPSLAWYLRDTVGVGSMTLGAIAFGTFLVAFLAPLVRRAFGSRGALWFAGGGLAGIRLLEQFSGTPALDLYLSLAGSALFLIFLSAFLGHSRAVDGPRAASRVAGGLILGLAFDSLIKGANATLDLSWTPALGAIVIVLGHVSLTLWLLAVEPAPNSAVPSDVGMGPALPLIAIGPLLLSQAMLLQNQGWVAEVSGLASPIAMALLLLGDVMLAAGAALAFSRPALHRPTVAAAIGLFLYIVLPRAEGLGASLPIGLLLLQAFLGWSLGLVLLRSAEPTRRGLASTSAATGLGMLLFLLLAFLYYVSFDLALPVPRASVVPTAAFVVALAVVMASVTRTSPAAPDRDLTALPSAAALTLLGLFIALLADAATPASPAPGVPGRVMTFNLHSAFSREGRLDPEEIARVIESGDAEVVALQEVSRGWLIDGSVDLVYWLARRTGMQVVFAGTADAVWGNALLSRVGFVETGSGPLPSEDVLLGRGYLWARVDVGWPEPLLVIGTHLHHIESEPGPRLEQIPVLLDFWGDAPRSVVLGDLNAEPDWPEMELMRQAGLVDAWQQAGDGPGLTWPADDPVKRIDWIWLSPDLQAVQASTIASTASDHLAVVVDLSAP